MKEVYYLPKLVKKELENLKKFCESLPYDAILELELAIDSFLDSLKESIELDYVELKN